MHALYLDTSKRSTEEEAFIAGQGAHWVIVSLEGGQKLKGLIVPHLDGVVRWATEQVVPIWQFYMYSYICVQWIVAIVQKIVQLGKLILNESGYNSNAISI